MKFKSRFLSLVFIVVNIQAGSEKSLLKWSPEQGTQPKVSVEVQWFKDNDYLSPNIDGMGKLQPYNAVMDTFCGDSKVLRKEFSE